MLPPKRPKRLLGRLVDRVHQHPADDGLLAESGVERLVADDDAAPEDDGDALVVRHQLAALRAFLLGGLDEALLEDDRVTARAAELGVRELHGRLDGGRPQRPDLDLSTLEVDQADDHRLQLRIRLAGLHADELRVVRDRSGGGRRAAEAQRGARPRALLREHRRLRSPDVHEHVRSGRARVRSTSVTSRLLHIWLF